MRKESKRGQSDNNRSNLNDGPMGGDGHSDPNNSTTQDATVFLWDQSTTFLPAFVGNEAVLFWDIEE